MVLGAPGSDEQAPWLHTRLNAGALARGDTLMSMSIWLFWECCRKPAQIQFFAVATERIQMLMLKGGSPRARGPE